jgi:hypothetical protein
MACRYLQLSEEISEFDEQLDRLVAGADRRRGPWHRHGGLTADRHWRQPPAHEERGSLRPPVRSRPDPSLLWQGRSSPLKPPWQPRRQPGPLCDRFRPHAPRLTHPGLRGSPFSRGQVQRGDYPLSRALHRSRTLSCPYPSIIS